MNEIIRQWLVEVLGYSDQNVFRSGQEGPVPTGDFVTYQWVGLTPASCSLQEDVDAGSGEVIRKYYSKGRASFQVDIYAANGMELHHDLSQASYLPTVRALLQDNYVSHIGFSDVRDLTFLVDTKHKARYQCDHDFLFWNTIIEPADGAVASYKITGQYQPGIQETIIGVP